MKKNNIFTQNNVNFNLIFCKYKTIISDEEKQSVVEEIKIC